MNFTVRIYGTPVGFDTYNVQSEQDLGYCQIFDDGSSEQEKFKVHYRPGLQQVTYNYLRYNCITQPGRPNAFFGISIVFQGEYCKDPMSIYDLFKFVYKTLLEKGWILSELASKNAQAQFNIQKFSDAQTACDSIIALLSNNIKSHLASSILALNIPAPRDASQVACYAPQQADNNKILQALATCGSVSISPDYSAAANTGGGEIALGVVEAILIKYRELKKSFEKWSVEVDTFNQNFSVKQNLGTANELKSEWQAHLSDGNGIADEIAKTDTVIASWLQKKRTHKQLIEAKKMVESLNVTCAQRVNNFRQYQQFFSGGGHSGGGNGGGGNGGGGHSGGGNSGDGGHSGRNGGDNFKKFIYHNKKLVALILVGIVILVAILTTIALTRDDKIGEQNTQPTVDQETDSTAPVGKPSGTLNTDEYVDLGRQELVKDNHAGAYQYFKLAGANSDMENVRNEYYDKCLKDATGHPEKEETFKTEMKKVDYIPTDADLQKIRKTSKSTTKNNTEGSKPDDDAGNGATNKAAKYSIRIYDSQNKEIQDLIARRKYTFKCYKDGKEDTGGTWYCNGKQTNNPISMKSGPNQIEYKVNGTTVQSISKTLK